MQCPRVFELKGDEANALGSLVANGSGSVWSPSSRSKLCVRSCPVYLQMTTSVFPTYLGTLAGSVIEFAFLTSGFSNILKIPLVAL